MMNQEVKANKQTIEDGHISDCSEEEDFTKEDWKIYTQSVKESDGFDVVIPEKFYVMDGIVPVFPSRLKAQRAKYEKWARYAIEEYNKHENKSLEFVEIIKVNQAHAAGAFYYFTLLVKDKEANDAAMRDLICRAKVWDGMRGDNKLVSFNIVTGEKY